ncbi:MAG: hypothetical protein M1465_01200 [Candidatus Marsarchaeota archaeon]|nr:hypothetical protein [Candidatus Marsarchaeota archaeon]
MASIKRSNVARHLSVIAMLLIMLAFLPGYAHAAGSGYSNESASFCSGIIQKTTTITSGNLLSSSTFVISIGLVALMFAIVGFTYAIGYAFGIGPLLNFSKTELGEIGITLIIIIVLLGTMAAITGGTSPGRIFSNYNFYGIFNKDCYVMTLTALNTTSDFRGIAITQDIFSLMSSTKVSIDPNYFGFSMFPFVGLTVINQIIKMMMEFTGIIIALFFGISIFLAIIYGLFPIFLYVGIVLRTIPWTRAAGGAFLGLFIGFYILLPLLIGFVATASFVSLPPVSFPATSLFTISSVLNPIASLTGLASLVNSNMIILFIEGVVAPSIYVIIGVVISIILSLDFAETMGDYLGAPSLSSSHALKGLV